MTAAWIVLVVIGLAGSLTFCGLYLRVATWYRSAVGRNLMAMAATLAGLLGMSLLGLVWRPPPWLWLGGMASLDAVMWWRVVLLWRTQHRVRVEEEKL